MYLILKVIKMMDRLGENNLKYGKKLMSVYVNKNTKELITLDKK